MKGYDFDRLLDDKGMVNEKIEEFLKTKVLKLQQIDMEEVKGHILKAEHNLKFVADNIKMRYTDWAIIGCYYASYHAALALIMTKGCSSKSHLATLCVLIRDFYKKGLDREDIETISMFIDYQDILFYVESKNKREDAAYSTRLKYDSNEAESLRLKAITFVSKIKAILGPLI